MRRVGVIGLHLSEWEMRGSLEGITQQFVRRCAS